MVTIFLVTIVITKFFLVSRVMTFPQVALAVSVFLPAIMPFLVTVASLIMCLSWPDEVVLCNVASEDMMARISSLLPEVMPLHYVSLILVPVKVVSLPSVGIWVVVLVLYLAMQCSTS